MEIRIEAPGLWQRYQKGDAFRRYVDERAPLIVPVGVLFLVFSLATTAGAVVIIGGTHSVLVLFMLILAPFLIGGTFCVLVFLFFSWLESRAIALTLARVRKATPRRPELSWRGVLAAAAALRTTFAATPALVWLLFAVLVVAPLLLLAKLSGAAATLLLVLLVAAPVAYAYLDR